MSRNRLVDETSPYLLQHKDNPVHWWAWGTEALAEAKRSNKPILLSVGYAACHWCHVMAHESFEDDATAAVMNELFVNVKVDREERPDIDTIYMTALHSLGEHGGWPLTMFLTPDAEPFWGGTYFPKEPQFGRADFVSVLKEVSRVFAEEPQSVRHNATLLAERLAPKRPEAAAGALAESMLAEAAGRLVSVIDPLHGGLQGAPKFPQTSFLSFLWRAGLRYGLAPCLDAVDRTLRHICQGGIYDHLGGGFARYSVDEKWLVPHFEKMLYDNAQLLDLMTEVWRERRSPLLAERIAETADWVLREMVAEGGGFAASLDADSEGEEGKFYVWSEAEVVDVLGAEDAGFFAEVYEVTASGNWEGTTILNRLQAMDRLSDEDEARLAEMRRRLFARREGRIRPGWDDKVLADWNGLTIAAMAKAADVFGRADWLGAAVRAYAFVVEHMTREGRLLHAARAGAAKAPATSSDYADMIAGGLQLAAVTGEANYVADAEGWADVLDRHYWSEALGGYHFTADDTDDVIVRTLTGHDEATPNANGVMVSNLMQLWLLTGKDAYRARAEAIVQTFLAPIARNMLAHASLLLGGLDTLAPQHIVIVGADGADGAGELTAALHRLSLPGAVVQVLDDPAGIAGTSPAAGKTALDGAPTAYVCIGPQCAAPVTAADALVDTVRTMRALPQAAPELPSAS